MILWLAFTFIVIANLTLAIPCALFMMKCDRGGGTGPG